MNRKAFTLIEVLCVIVLLAILTTFASTSIMNMSKKGKENLYCTKIALIKSAAKDYAITKEKELNNSSDTFRGHKSITIKVNDLVLSGKLEADTEENVINPIDNSIMNDIDIILYLDNNQIYSYIKTDNIC